MTAPAITPGAASPLKGFAGVARANFLVLPLTLAAVGGAAAAFNGRLDLAAVLLATLGLVAVHAAVNAFNEVSDIRTGIDLVTQRTPFSGGSGTLPAGIIPTRVAERFAWLAFAVGAAIGVWAIARVGWPLVPVIAAGAIAVLFYTPWLGRTGVGEIFAGLGLGALPIIGVAMVSGSPVNDTVLVASLPAFFMTFDLLLLNEFPDERADRAGGRRHLVILLGRRAAARIYVLAAVLVPVTIVAGVLLGALPGWALLGLLPSLLLVKPLGWALGSAEGDPPLPALGANVVWNLATNTLLAVGLGLASALG
ncbi:MAG TPA: prenyltransferase [Gemmatimonadaceae bacterium]